MNTHNTHRVHRVDTHAPRKPRPPQFRARVIKRAPLVDLSDPFEIASLVALVIGVVVLVGMIGGWL